MQTVIINTLLEKLPEFMFDGSVFCFLEHLNHFTVSVLPLCYLAKCDLVLSLTVLEMEDSTFLTQLSTSLNGWTELWTAR